jgi:hypothetical protein
MRKVVDANWLRREIDARMGYAPSDTRNFLTSVERCSDRDKDEPNWRYSFNPGEVPAGFEKRRPYMTAATFLSRRIASYREGERCSRHRTSYPYLRFRRRPWPMPPAELSSPGLRDPHGSRYQPARPG